MIAEESTHAENLRQRCSYFTKILTAVNGEELFGIKNLLFSVKILEHLKLVKI